MDDLRVAVAAKFEHFQVEYFLEDQQAVVLVDGVVKYTIAVVKEVDDVDVLIGAAVATEDVPEDDDAAVV